MFGNITSWVSFMGLGLTLARALWVLLSDLRAASVVKQATEQQVTKIASVSSYWDRIN